MSNEPILFRFTKFPLFVILFAQLWLWLSSGEFISVQKSFFVIDLRVRRAKSKLKKFIPFWLDSGIESSKEGLRNVVTGGITGVFFDFFVVVWEDFDSLRSLSLCFSFFLGVSWVGSCCWVSDSEWTFVREPAVWVFSVGCVALNMVPFVSVHAKSWTSWTNMAYLSDLTQELKRPKEGQEMISEVEQGYSLISLTFSTFPEVSYVIIDKLRLRMCGKTHVLGLEETDLFLVILFRMYLSAFSSSLVHPELVLLVGY